MDCDPINPIGDIEENKDKDKKNCKSRIPCKELLQLWWGAFMCLEHVSKADPDIGEKDEDGAAMQVD